MKKTLNELSPEELGKLFPIKIVEYDPHWKVLFQNEKVLLEKILGKDLALRIEHFGSTSIPGLAAKPTIDILMEIPKEEKLAKEITIKLQNHGYHFFIRKDAPPPYLNFVKGYSETDPTGQTYHIHAVSKDHSQLWDRLFFRDYLSKNQVVAKDYEILKKQLAQEFQFHREKYMEGKTSFVKRITEIAKKHFK